MSWRLWCSWRWALLWLGHPAETFYKVNKARNPPEPGQLVVHHDRLLRVTAVDGDGDTLYFQDGSTGSWMHCCGWPREPRTSWWHALPPGGKALYVLLGALPVACLIVGVIVT